MNAIPFWGGIFFEPLYKKIKLCKNKEGTQCVASPTNCFTQFDFF